MCPPTYFDVTYSINPWMRPGVPVDRVRAFHQWLDIKNSFQRLGHSVEIVNPEPGLSDMVYAANGGLVIDGIAVRSRFLYAERRLESSVYASWLRDGGFQVDDLTFVNEGEGDFLLAGNTLIAGYGFRSDRRSHREIASHFDLPYLSLKLVDPNFYHLDTALCVLDDRLIAYYPAAFSSASQAALETYCPNAIKVSEEDALAFGLNSVSDGLNVVMPSGARSFARTLKEYGFRPVTVDIDQILLGGGGVKCCTLELRPAAAHSHNDQPAL
jgi:N-dimethylarginine dimethylaminohydrolase